LAPALSVISSKALYYFLRMDKIPRIFKGIDLPDGSPLLNMQFTDDTAIYLVLKEENLNNLKIGLGKFW